jgi:choline dehydrogenase
VNATVALRARPADFAKWGAHGAEGWSFDDALPAFKLLENTPAGDDAYHGRTGPLPIRQRTDAELTPSLRGFVDAAVAQGFKRVHDFNGADQNGTDGYPVDVVDGVRQNTGLVYLTAEVRRRPNLTIRGDVTIDRVLFDATTATGVLAADGTVYRAREVILSGGTYGSPAILLRSGIGPAGDLTTLSIDVVADLPVGQRLQDQPGYANAYALAPGYLEMTPAVGSLLWTASTEAVGDELDLHITAVVDSVGAVKGVSGLRVVDASIIPEVPSATTNVTVIMLAERIYQRVYAS